jgi:hypothetical protein
MTVVLALSGGGDSEVEKERRDSILRSGFASVETSHSKRAAYGDPYWPYTWVV